MVAYRFIENSGILDTPQTSHHIMIDLFPQSHVKKILISDTEHIDRLLSAVNIHHRHARSLKFTGTALKIIAASSNIDDIEDSRLKLE